MNNTLRLRQKGRHFADDTFKRIFVNENVRIPIEISLKFVPKGPIDNIPALVWIMAWRRPGDKSLSEPMMVKLQTHIWVTRPQWDKLVDRFTSCLMERPLEQYKNKLNQTISLYHKMSLRGKCDFEAIVIIGCNGSCCNLSLNEYGHD